MCWLKTLGLQQTLTKVRAFLYWELGLLDYKPISINLATLFILNGRAHECFRMIHFVPCLSTLVPCQFLKGVQYLCMKPCTTTAPRRPFVLFWKFAWKWPQVFSQLYRWRASGIWIFLMSPDGDEETILGRESKERNGGWQHLPLMALDDCNACRRLECCPVRIVIPLAVYSVTQFCGEPGSVFQHFGSDCPVKTTRCFNVIWAGATCVRAYQRCWEASVTGRRSRWQEWVNYRQRVGKVFMTSKFGNF